MRIKIDKFCFSQCTEVGSITSIYEFKAWIVNEDGTLFYVARIVDRSDGKSYISNISDLIDIRHTGTMIKEYLSFRKLTY